MTRGAERESVSDGQVDSALRRESVVTVSKLRISCARVVRARAHQISVAIKIAHEDATRAERHAVGMGRDIRGVVAPTPRIGTFLSPGNMVVCVEKATTSMRDGAGA